MVVVVAGVIDTDVRYGARIRHIKRRRNTLLMKARGAGYSGTTPHTTVQAEQKHFFWRSFLRAPQNALHLPLPAVFCGNVIGLAGMAIVHPFRKRWRAASVLATAFRRSSDSICRDGRQPQCALWHRVNGVVARGFRTASSRFLAVPAARWGYTGGRCSSWASGWPPALQGFARVSAACQRQRTGGARSGRAPGAFVAWRCSGSGLRLMVCFMPPRINLHWRLY